MKGVKGSKAELFIVAITVFIVYRSYKARTDYYYQQSEMWERKRLKILDDLASGA